MHSTIDSSKGARAADPYEDSDARGREYGRKTDLPDAAALGFLARRLNLQHVVTGKLGWSKRPIDCSDPMGVVEGRVSHLKAARARLLVLSSGDGTPLRISSSGSRVESRAPLSAALPVSLSLMPPSADELRFHLKYPHPPPPPVADICSIPFAAGAAFTVRFLQYYTPKLYMQHPPRSIPLSPHPS